MSIAGTYSVDMVCTNCGKKFTKDYPKGTKVSAVSILCPNCGCLGTCKKAWSPPDPPPHRPYPYPYRDWEPTIYRWGILYS